MPNTLCAEIMWEMAAMEGPKHAEVALLIIPMDSVQYNTEHCGINDDMDDEHRV